MLALLFPHSRQGFVFPKILQAPDPPVLATASPNGADSVRLFFLLRPVRRERKIFLAKKSNDSFVDLKSYFGIERAPCRCSPEPMLAGNVLLGILNHHGLVGAEGTSQPQPPVSPLGLRTPEPAGGQGGCAIPPYTFQFCPYPFRPLAGFVMQRKLVRSLDKQTGNRVLRCAYILSAGGLILNRKKRLYLFLLFINTEPCALKTSPRSCWGGKCAGEGKGKSSRHGMEWPYQSAL